jgi:TonB-linked SusC/RagA family outer membrane protein
MKKRLRMQHFALFFLLCVGSILHAQAQTKEQTVTVNLKNATLSEVFTAIEKQTTYRFSYRDLVIDNRKDITISKTSVPVSEVLKAVLASRNLEYTILSSQSIVISDKQEKSKGGNGNVRRMTGSIRDEKGEPIVGATFLVKGTSIGTISDINGNYSIIIPDNNSILEVSFIGFEKQEIKMTEQSTNIMLVESTKTLDEVVVIGYGSIAKKNIVGAIDKVSSQAIEDRPVGNLSQALQGVSSSVVIQHSSFNPNEEGLNINIRGVSTLSDNEPLVVLDGLVVDSSTLNLVNPSDIDNISVLKDAGSAAIYGSRSANGVILITTKQGKKSATPVINVNTSVGIQNPHILFRPVKGYENAILRDQALINAGSTPVYTPEEIRAYKENGDCEWFLDQILKSALQQTYNVSMSGGSNTSTYMLSAGYYDQKSNFVGPDYGIKRYNFRSNISSESGRFKLTGILSYVRTNNKNHTATSSFLLVDAYRTPVYYNYKMKDANGHYLINDVLSESNPLGLLEAGGTSNSDNDNVTGSGNIEFKIIKGLKIKAVYGFDLKAEHNLLMRKQIPFYASETSTTPALYANSTRDTEDYNGKSLLQNTQAYFDFDRTFSKAHHVTGVLGVSSETAKYTSNELIKKYTDTDLGITNSDTQIDVNSYTTPESTIESALNSIFGRIGYSYNDKYFGEFNFREDGSSKFAKGNRWCFFPSISAGWRISEEKFMTFYKDEIGDFKLRGSYGILGNQSVSDYQYQTTYNIYTGAYGFNNTLVSGAYMTGGNNDLKWESSATLNVGFDATFLKSVLNVSFDYFHKVTSDILLEPTVPSTYGGNVSSYNAGEMKNQGWELNLGYRFKTGEIKHNLNFNLSDTRNKVTKFEGDEQITTYDEMQTIIRVGQPINSYYGYKTDGYFQNYSEIEAGPTPVGTTLSPGDVRYKDQNGDNIINDKDRVILGNGFPRYTFGLTYNVSWKGFDLSMLIQGVGKRSMFLRGELVEPFHSNYSYTMYTHQLNFWTPVNPDARWPRLSAPSSASDINNYQKSSSLHMFNAAYLRLKNIQLGYSLPQSLISKGGIKKVRAYINAQNLLTLCKTKFIDPESTEFGSDMSSSGANSGRNYPTLIFYGCGLDIEF